MSTAKKTVLILTAIVLLAVFLRVYRIAKSPPGIDWDEASYGYNAYSILKTGADEWGNRLPIKFRAFGDVKPPLLVYLNIPFIAAFGLNTISVKLVSIAAGCLSVIMVYLLALLLFKRRNIAFLSALLMAFSPYGIFYSRIGIEMSLFSFLTISTVYFEVSYLKKKDSYSLLFTLLFLALVFLSSHPGKILAPSLALLFLTVNYLATGKSFKKSIPTIIFVFGLCIYLLVLSKQSWYSRMQYVGIFGSNKSVELEIGEYRNHDENSIVSRLAHNKGTFYALRVLRNYSTHFTLDYLVHSSEPSVVQVAFRGPLYTVQLPFYYLGLFLLVVCIIRRWNHPDKFLYLILLLWIFAAPLPSTLTEGAISKRYMGALGSWELITAFGIVEFFNWARKRMTRYRLHILLFFTCTLLYGYEVIGFLNMNFWIIPNLYGSIYFVRQNGVGMKIAENYPKFDRIIVANKITGEPYIFTLFFMKYKPRDFLASKKWTQDDNGWITVRGFGKTEYTDDLRLDSVKPLKKNEKVLYFVTLYDLRKNNNLDYLRKRGTRIDNLEESDINPDEIYSFSLIYD